jgi:hypothetical protein
VGEAPAVCTSCGATPTRARRLCAPCYDRVRRAGTLHRHQRIYRQHRQGAPDPTPAPPALPPVSPAALNRLVGGIVAGLERGDIDRRQVVGMLAAMTSREAS